MALLIQYVVLGLAVGSLYALVALGIVLLYRTSRILNFAHGDLATFGTFVAFALLTTWRWPFAAASVGSLIATAVVGAAFFFLIIRPAKESSLLGKI
ncbi:MAG: ABC transporter permease subunit, partial [bacterium]